VIRRWSRGAKELFGYAEAEAVGRSLDLIVPGTIRESHWAGCGAVREFAGRLIVLRDEQDRVIGAMIVYTEEGDGRA
jgi:hypothetical protein